MTPLLIAMDYAGRERITGGRSVPQLAGNIAAAAVYVAAQCILFYPFILRVIEL